MKPIKLFEMFAGYGGASFALKKANIPFECVGYSEIDKWAIQCYEQNHGNIKNYGDCRNIDPNTLPNFDLLTGGFPCQSFSATGKGKGENDPRGTLFYEIIRIAEIKQPKYMLLENVKGITFKKFNKTFNNILNELDRIGYIVNWQLLNTADYNIPQNRERVWFVCIRKDLSINFVFPQPIVRNCYLYDILESDVDLKYYMPQSKTNTLIGELPHQDISLCIDENYYKSTTVQTFVNYRRRQLVYACITPNMINKYCNGRRIKNENEPMFTLTSQNEHGIVLVENNKINIRRLTPKECFRLMGFLNDEINLNGLSDTQCYRLAGNGWDINLVSKIFNNLFNQKEGWW